MTIVVYNLIVGLITTDYTIDIDNHLNQYGTVDDTVEVKDYDYDGNGNLDIIDSDIGDDYDFDYDYENRLIQVQKNSSIIAMLC